MARYALVDKDDKVTNVIELEEGASYQPPAGLTLVKDRDFPVAPSVSIPVLVIDGASFLARVHDDEYLAITSSSNVQVKRWIDIFRLRGEIDVTGATSKAAKAGLVQLGLLTQARADEIFAPPR